MTERDPLAYDPNDLARDLNVKTGLDWSAWRQGETTALPELSLLAGFRRDEHGRVVLAGLLLLGDAVTGEMLRKVPVAALENGRNLADGNTDDVLREELRKLTPLQSADRSDPKAFSQLVADHYNAWARAVSHPVAAMAAEAGVKPPTVHTWVREARLRGLLPAARRGKASR